MDDIAVQASKEIDARRQILAEAIVRRQYALQSQVWTPYGEPGMAKSVRDAGYHLSYLTQALGVGDPGLFLEYVAWVKVLFAGLGFADNVIVTTLNLTRDVLDEALQADLYQAVLPYLDGVLAALPDLPNGLDSQIRPDNPLSGLAKEYLDALLRGDRAAASRLILAAVQEGTSVRDVYLNVFQPSQREIGRLWQMNQISVAQEHFCTAATQMIMSQLYPHIFSGARADRRLVVACVGGELHEIGARMVADFFEMDGWDTYFLGANTPHESILATVDDRAADVLALSATMTFHVGEVTEIISALRRSETLARTRVLVGGYPFNLSPGLWQTTGADGYASDAQAAVREAMKVLHV